MNMIPNLTVFTYHTKVLMTEEEITKIMDFIGTTLGNNMTTGGARRLTNLQAKDFWKHYNSKKEVKKKKVWTVMVKKNPAQLKSIKPIPKPEEVIEFTQDSSETK